jgi:hypothetical protein
MTERVVAEDVVEVACDAFAFGDGGELDVLFLGGAELAVGSLLLGDEGVGGADDCDKEYSRSYVDDVAVQPQGLRRCGL